ncbi:MAG: Sec-independent protein translocase protein TatB [Sphingomonadales bacterium]|jgi:sec-independent protein translocase protein TatB
MFDFAWSELLIVIVIAIVVVGPKDLPRMMRVLGRLVARARAIAGEFRLGLDQLAREAELDELKKQANDISQVKPGRIMEDMMKPDAKDKGQGE